MPFLLAVQQHRGLANAVLNGDAESRLKLTESEVMAQKAIERMDAVHAKLAGEWGLADTWNKLKTDWAELNRSTLSLSASQSFTAHSAYIERLLDLMSNAAGASQLSFESDREVYYVFDITVNRLPNLIEYIGKARGMGNGALARRQISADEKIALYVADDHINEAFAGLEKGLAVLSQSNDALYKSLQELSEENIGLLNSFSKTLDNQILQASVLNMRPSDYFSEGTRAIEGSVALYNKTASELANLLDQRNHLLQKTRLQIGMVLVSVLLLAGLFFAAFYVSVRRTVRMLAQVSGTMAEGKLTERVELETKDELREIGIAFNQMAEQLSMLIHSNLQSSGYVSEAAKGVSESVTKATEAAEHITLSVGKIALGEETQTRTLQEIGIAVNEMATGIQRIAESTESVSGAAIHAAHDARSGNESMKRAVLQMHAINEAVDRSKQAVDFLGQRSEEINQIVGAITQITSQTQLLSLNASVEAARAGEHGRGFTIVATEVGKLGEQTRISAETIAHLVNEVLTAVQSIVKLMLEVSSETHLGVSLINESDRMFTSIINAVDQVAMGLEEMSAASEEITAGTQEVAASMFDAIDIAKAATEQAVKSSEYTKEQQACIGAANEASKKLAQQAQIMRDKLSEFQI
ncbi:methyl-accepting chemotaxis protein [Paenibacillus sp. sgz500958]|uniref:methyl-accepting chemotaxis protein n=1 Tax=Paenibacillus sp. sgz500958 TaxID=3242475 RepID=UPI0036D3CB21